MIKLIAGGKEFIHWSNIDIKLNLNTVASTFTLTGLYDERTKFIFEPFSYIDCEVWIVDEDKGINEKLLTGVLLNPGILKKKTPNEISISGFTKTGILETVNMPKGISLQYQNTSIATVAKIITDSLGLTLKIHEGAAGAAAELFEEIECKASESLYNFLNKLCVQKGITVAHDNLGNLFLYRILNVIPASSKLSQDDYNIQLELAPNGQGMHSELTVYREEPMDDEPIGDNAKDEVPNELTISSPWLKDQYLPMSRVMKEGDTSTMRVFGEKILCLEAKNFPIKVKKEGWDFEGRIVRNGFFFILDAPDLFIEETKFVVESMRFTKAAKGPEMLEFTLLLPCVYTGKLPRKSPFKT